MLYPNDTTLEGFLNSAGFDTRIVMEFDVFGISGSIVSADILFPIASRVASGTMLDIFAYSGNGTMELADAFAGAAAGSFAPTTSGVNTIGLTAGTLQSLLDGGATYIGIVMLTPIPGQAVWRDVTNNTVLRLDVVPRVAIDIRPGSDRNGINPRSKGKIPVAILSTGDFDATQVDPATVRFGPDEAPAVGYSVKDVDYDGDWDLVVRFKKRDTGITCGDTEATLVGETYEGQAITGTDFIKVKGCPPTVTTLDQYQLTADQTVAIHATIAAPARVGQTFTVDIAGTLESVELSLSDIGSGGDLVVNILDMNGGDLSLAPSLGSVNITEDDLGPFVSSLDAGSVNATLINLTSLNISVNVGDVLAIDLSTSRSLPNLYGVRRQIGADNYLGGSHYAGNGFLDGFDLAFKTFISTVTVHHRKYGFH